MTAHPCIALTGANPSPLIEGDAMPFRGPSWCRESGRRVSVGADSSVSSGTPRPASGRWGSSSMRALRMRWDAMFAIGRSWASRPPWSRPFPASPTRPGSLIRPLGCGRFRARATSPVRRNDTRRRNRSRRRPPSRSCPPKRRPIHGDATQSRPLAIPTRLDRPPRSPAPVGLIRPLGRPSRVTLHARSARPGRSHDALRLPSLRGNPPGRVGVRPPARLGLWNAPRPWRGRGSH